MSSNLAQAIQHYVIKFASLLVAGSWFSLCTPFSSTNTTDPVESGVKHQKPVDRTFPIVYLYNLFMFFLLYRTPGFIRKVCRC
jgi:hypothetical protein